MAIVAGFDVPEDEAEISCYVAERPILTVPDPWFYAGLVALEATKICGLFPPGEIEILLRRISENVDRKIGRRGRAVARLVLALMGRLGYGAVLMHTRVPDARIAKVILVMMGNQKTWAHLLPNATATRQVRAALKLGEPLWWYYYSREAIQEARPAESARLPRRHHCPAGLAKRRAVFSFGPPQPIFRCHPRKYGLDGQSLHI